MPWYHYELPRAIQRLGHGVDYVSQALLREGMDVHNDVDRSGARAGATSVLPGWQIGGRTFDLLVLMEVDSIDPGTWAKVAAGAEAGARFWSLATCPTRPLG